MNTKVSDYGKKTDWLQKQKTQVLTLEQQEEKSDQSKIHRFLFLVNSRIIKP